MLFRSHGQWRGQIVGHDSGWRPCTAKAIVEDVEVTGRQRSLCDEHHHEITLLARHHPNLLDKLRWAGEAPP